MIRISKDPSFRVYYQMNKEQPFERSGGHNFYHAERFVRDNYGGRRPDGKYVLVELKDITPDELDRWDDSVQSLLRKNKLPLTIIHPEETIYLNGNLACVVNLDDPKDGFELLSLRRNMGDYRLVFELFAKGLMDAASVRLRPVNFFIDSRNYRILVDTLPTRSVGLWETLDVFLQRLGDRVDPNHSLQKLRSTTAIFNTLAQQLDVDYQPVNGRHGASPEKIKVMAKIIQPSGRNAANVCRGILEWSPGDPPVMLRDLPRPMADVLPAKPLLEIQRGSRGEITLRNVSKYIWESTRYSGMEIRPGAKLVPRINEMIFVELRMGMCLEMRVQGFEGSAAPVPSKRAVDMPQRTIAQPQKIPAQDAVAKSASSAVSDPVTANVGGQTSAKPANVVKHYSDKYDYEAPELPAKGHSVPATELKGGRRVMLEHYGDVLPELRKALLEQKTHRLDPVDGLCGMIDLHENKLGSDFILVREAPAGAGWYSAASPELRALSSGRLFAAGERMMRILDGVLRQGWIPVRFIETHIRIDPRTLKARFMDGAWLARENKVPLECTLGYRPPEAYAQGYCAALPDVSYCAAVWLYRLLIGGYPMEGKMTRGMLLEVRRAAENSGIANGEFPGEAELAQKLYGEAAVFAFDPGNNRNSIRGLGGAFDDQLKRWNAMPEPLRNGWIRTFSTCLHSDVTKRVSPAEWAELLHREAEKGV